MEEITRVAKGFMHFRFSKDGLQVSTRSMQDICSNSIESTEHIVAKLTKHVYTMMSGEEFLQSVKDTSITNYDGHVAQVFVDGYISNLGLSCDNFESGGFLVDEGMWKHLCIDFHIEVNWANK